MAATSDKDRAALIEKTLPYARRLALQALRDLPRGVPVDDIVSAANAGLVDAAQRYDATRGAQFTTFAHYRIRGAILDYVRDVASDHPVYRARAAAEAAVDSLVEQRLGNAPAPASQADAAQQLASIVGEIATTCTLAEIAAQTAPVTAPDPESALQHTELSTRFVEAIAKLPERERRVVQSVYFEAQTIEQAGRAMGLSKSWASRLHARAIALLRAELEALGGDW